MPMATAAHPDGAGNPAAPIQAGAPATVRSNVPAGPPFPNGHEANPAQPSTTAAGGSNDSAGIQSGALGTAPTSAAGPQGKALTGVAAAAQQRHADLAAAASRRAAEVVTAPLGRSKSSDVQPSGKSVGSSGGGSGQQRHSGGNSQPAPTAVKPKRALTPGEAEQRAKRRRRHEEESAVRRRLDLRRRVADVTSELEVLQNEVNCIRVLWAEPPPPDLPLTDAQRGALVAAAQRRTAELLTKTCGAVLKSIMGHKWAYPFNQPVDLKMYTTYLTYVSRPMDFGTIKRNLESGAYPDPEAFAADVRQVFANANEFNPEGSNVRVMATHLQERFEDRWRNSIAPRIADVANAARIDELNAIHAAGEAAHNTRTEGLVGRAEALTAALDALGHRLADALSVAAAHCQPLSYPEKDDLARAIPRLDRQAFNAVMGIVTGRQPELHAGGSDTVIDFDRLDALTLRQLQSFVATAKATGHSVLDEAITNGEPPVPQPAPSEGNIVWPGLLAGAGVRGYRQVPSHSAPLELRSGDSAEQPPATGQPSDGGTPNQPPEQGAPAAEPSAGADPQQRQAGTAAQKRYGGAGRATAGPAAGMSLDRLLSSQASSGSDGAGLPHQTPAAAGAAMLHEVGDGAGDPLLQHAGSGVTPHPAADPARPPAALPALRSPAEAVAAAVDLGIGTVGAETGVRDASPDGGELRRSSGRMTRAAAAAAADVAE